MQLAELQRAFQDHVLHDDRAVEQVIQGTAQFPLAARLGVYSDAYRLRLVDALAHNYPRLQQLLGLEAFAQLARGYLAAAPSTHVSVRWFGNRLAGHLAQHADYCNQPWLAELAQWEWAIAAAFDAPDAEPLEIAALGYIGPEEWPTLRFQFHPSLQVLRLQTNAPALGQALADGNEPPAPAMLAAAQSWSIWRQGLTPQLRLLNDDEANALQTMRGAGTFEAMCESLCEFHEAAEVPLIAAGLLKAWISHGLIGAVLRD